MKKRTGTVEDDEDLEVGAREGEDDAEYCCGEVSEEHSEGEGGCCADTVCVSGCECICVY